MRVDNIQPNSIAAKAGLQKGDELTTFENQPLISTADFSWVLHHAPDESKLSLLVQRGGQELPVKLTLPRAWRAQSDISRRVGTWPMRAMATGGMLLKDLSDEDRAQRGLTTKQLALRAEHVGEYGNHAAAKKAGFRKEDVLIAVDGIDERLSESQLIGRLIAKSPGEKVQATVLRGQKKIQLQFPIQ